MKLKQAQKLLTEWQKRLRLQDWRIHLGFARQAQMSDTQVTGNCRVFNPSKMAWITLLQPVDHYPYTDLITNKVGTVDTEHDLIHELLHITLDKWPHDKGHANDDVEVAIETIADALMALKYSKKRT
jgi:hypothetical protein